MKYSKEVKCKMLNKPVRKKFFTRQRKDDLFSFCIAFIFSMAFVALIFLYIFYG